MTDDPYDSNENLTEHIRIAPSTHRALKEARRGDMNFDDVIRHALYQYEPIDTDPATALEEGV